MSSYNESIDALIRKACGHIDWLRDEELNERTVKSLLRENMMEAYEKGRRSE